MVPQLSSDRTYGGVTVLFGAENGRYPSGNSLVIQGTEETLLVDPSLAVHERGGAPAAIDRVLVSHAHEDHLAALHLYADVPVFAHEADVDGVRSLDGLLDIYGLDPLAEADFRVELVETFNIGGHGDVRSFVDGTRFDLGGGRSVSVVHLPGHTGGHSGFLVEPDGFFFIADVDLTGFGPYYGDAASSLEGFLRSLDRCRDIDARWYGTFHHKGLVEGREPFLAQLAEFGDVLRRREDALLAFLHEPRRLEEIVAHRFVYRPHVDSVFVDTVERRTAAQHLALLVPAGRVAEVEPGRYRAVA
ncbi:MAG: MBL fold metallo-hydrolase [Acidimicrobiia bacterium]|nr:MBL fold metallo-hydrolase [Acidimicrobiia bacterium]